MSEVDEYQYPSEQFLKGAIKIAGYGLLAILAFLILNPIVTVPAGYQGILLTWGASTGVMNPGLNLKIPIAQDVILMETRTVRFDSQATAATKDLLDVKTDVALNYHIKEGAVSDIYQSVGGDYQGRLIAPAVQEVVKSVTAKFTAEELVTQRANVKQLIDEGLTTRLASRDIVVETISITNFEFPAAFNAAIEAKQTAVQKALEAQNVVAQREAEAKQAIMIAQGQANATVIQAQGNAQAIEVVNSAIKNSPDYLKWQAIQKWNGVVPMVTGTGSVPFIELNMSQ